MLSRYRRWASHRAWRWWAQGNESALPQLISAAPEELREYEGFSSQAPLQDVKGDRTITTYDVAGEVLLPMTRLLDCNCGYPDYRVPHDCPGHLTSKEAYLSRRYPDPREQ
ncbi:hypothetical protein LCGC14_0445240 [marine sediment metagenome]|uniref:Uncharacterized protein n=1 Tax=marine sediment metagenome TaxID=412755 RepID=A0A0F9T2J1_9ZZZZ